MSKKEDFENALNDLLQQKVFIVAENNTYDSLGNPTSTSEPEIPVECSIQQISEKNWNIIAHGIPKTGTVVGYFKYQYTYDGSTYTLEEGNKLKYEGTYYFVEKIMEMPEIDGEIIYVKALLRRVQ